jgi:alpha-beta hydrolase superfamily lysophospholipase
MNEVAGHVKASDGKSLFSYQWMPENTPRCVLVVVHGMAEHAQRYASLAQFMNQQDIGVVAYDQRGHGRTVSEGEVLGHIKSRGWKRLRLDLVDAINQYHEQFPGIPLVLVGHSMGSLVSLNTMELHELPVKAWVLSALPLYEGLVSEAGRIFSNIQSSLLGRTSSGRIQTLGSFGKWNRRFKPNRTEVDWLSRDESEVDKYVNDPACGFPCTSGLWEELLKGHKSCFKSANLNAIPNDKPLLIFAGSEDPVVGMAKGFRSYESSLGSRVEHFQAKLYDGGRHESFNEINRNEVHQDLLTWLEDVL